MIKFILLNILFFLLFTLATNAKCIELDDSDVPYQANAFSAKGGKSGMYTNYPIDDKSQQGMSIWIGAQKCDEDNVPSRTTSEVFKTGDCAQLYFSTNVAGYFYLVNVDSKKNVIKLFPGQGDVKMVLPGGHRNFKIIFDEVIGDENFFLIHAKKKLPNVEFLAMNVGKSLSNNALKNFQIIVSDEDGNIYIPKGVRLYKEQLSDHRHGVKIHSTLPDSEIDGRNVMIMKMTVKHN